MWCEGWGQYNEKHGISPCWYFGPLRICKRISLWRSRICSRHPYVFEWLYPWSTAYFGKWLFVWLVARIHRKCISLFKFSKRAFKISILWKPIILLWTLQATIKKTLQDFKRTHQDNWQDHKLKFSDDQLAVLTDILVSPSYYA